MKMKRWKYGLVLLAALMLLSGCKKNPPTEALYAKLFEHFEQRGYAVKLTDAPVDEPMPIYNASVWKALWVGEECVFVYFDESNRADYLSEQADQEQYGNLTHFGLRFVLNYRGDDQGILQALQAINE